MERHKPFFEFIRYTIGAESSVPCSIENIDWSQFLDFCYRQSIMGLVFGGIERMIGENVIHNLDQELLLEWIGSAETIKATNVLVNKRAIHISQFFEGKNCHSCILKGQANATMYPRPELRSPGDIDIWVKKDEYPNDNKGDEVADVIRMVLKECPDAHYSLHHVTMPVFEDTAVEVHYRPIFLDNWLYDRRFVKTLSEVSDRQFANRVELSKGNRVGMLTDEVNALYQLLHMWHHLLSTHNNLKQLIDYYYLLKRGLKDGEKGWVASHFKKLGVEKYARGIMWIENLVLGLDTRYLILQPDEKIGKLLLRYVLEYGHKPKRSKASMLIHRITDNLPLMRYFPSAVIINPMYLIWHQWWKLKMKHKLKAK